MRNIDACLYVRPSDRTTLERLVADGKTAQTASAFASQDLPDLDVTLRGAVSIARRLQDPLAELVKIDPKSIGVGPVPARYHRNQTVALARCSETVAGLGFEPIDTESAAPDAGRRAASGGRGVVTTPADYGAWETGIPAPEWVRQENPEPLP